jgi:DNA-binding LytR/AlgR family response regulator
VIPRAVIAEDEPVLREQLQTLLPSVWPELKIAAIARNGVEAIAAIEQHAPHVLFLDIRMPGVSGLEVARIASGRCHVVFVTAYDRYAVSAFEQGAIDYVMKPLDAARLAVACNRVQARLDTFPARLDNLLELLAERAAEPRPYLRWINASKGKDIRIITVDEICYFRADLKYTLVVTPDAETLIRTPIKELHDALDPAVFWQVHRSTIVNVNAVAAVARDSSGRLTLKLKRRKEHLQVSQPYAHLFRQM